MPEQVWLVTGSSRGLGRSIVEEALAAGHRVAATARRIDSLADLADKYGDRLLPIVLDVTDATRAQRAVDEAIAFFGRLDVVVNNAGYADLVAIEDISLTTSAPRWTLSSTARSTSPKPPCRTSSAAAPGISSR